MLILNNATIEQLILNGEYAKLEILVRKANPNLSNLAHITRKLRYLPQDMEEVHRTSYSKAVKELLLLLHQHVVKIIQDAARQVYGKLGEQVIVAMQDDVMKDASMISYAVVNLLTKDPVAIVNSLFSLTPADIGNSMEGLERGLVVEEEVGTALALEGLDEKEIGRRAGYIGRLQEVRNQAKQHTLRVWGKNIISTAIEIVERSLSPDLFQEELEVLVTMLFTMSKFPSSAIRKIIETTNLTTTDIKQIVDNNPIPEEQKKEVLAALERM